jgi:cytochrome oxidase Cu insertion factor (SCO1/SenC/PrrC family)
MRRVWQLALGGFIGTLIVAVGVVAAFFWFQPSGVAGTHDDIASSSEYEGRRLDGPATDFRLMDHKGRSIALSDLRRKVVLLTFLDAVCDETCPLTALELRKVHHLLGGGAETDVTDQVVFLGVNVNVDRNRQADVQAFTDKFSLDQIPSWHFLTGTAEELRPIWEAYNIEVFKTEAGEEDYKHTRRVCHRPARGLTLVCLDTAPDRRPG